MMGIENVEANQRVESMTKGFKMINTDHMFIHKGIAYKTHISLASVSADVVYAIKTPVGKYLHFKNMKVAAMGGTLDVEVLRGATVTAAGDAVSSPELIGPVNLNDNSDNTAGTVITKGPTVSVAGTVWEKVRLPGNSTNQFTSVEQSQGSENEELVLLPDSYYLLKLSKVGDDNPSNVLLSVFWYEEDDG